MTGGVTRCSGGPVGPLLALLAVSCGVLSQEEQLLTRFFDASRLHDTARVATIATVTFNPRTDGIVQEFEIQDVVDEGDAKRVTVRAEVRSWGGRVAPRTLTITMRRDGGRWMIVGLR